MQSRHLRASGVHFSCPGKGRGVGIGAILEPNRERENEETPMPASSSRRAGRLLVPALDSERSASDLSALWNERMKDAY